MFKLAAKAILRSLGRKLPWGAKQALLEGIVGSLDQFERFQQLGHALGVESIGVRGKNGLAWGSLNDTRLLGSYCREWSSSLSAKLAYEHNLAVWSDIQGHLPRLKNAARGRVMEIGVRRGVSTSALLAGLEEHGGHLWSVDLDSCPVVFSGHPQWTFFRADSIKHAAALQALMPEAIDILLVDGDHSYEGALSDLLSFGPRTRRILVHDTDAPDFPGVRRAVEDFVGRYGRTVTYHPGSYGMAEIT
ncbi:MAG: class I SAM-dependent methyltransferase [Candidatus Sulfotelmatobacter sp.]